MRVSEAALVVLGGLQCKHGLLQVVAGAVHMGLVGMGGAPPRRCPRLERS